MFEPGKRIIVGIRLVEALRDILQGIISYSKAQNANWDLQCVDFIEFERRLSRKGIDGAIAHINPDCRKWLNRLVKSEVPIVNTLQDASPRIASVLSDDRRIGELGAEYFLTRGFRNFAFLGVACDWSRNRQTGFTSVLRSQPGVERVSEHVLPPQASSVIEAASVQQELRDWAAKLPKPTAVMACSDLTAKALLMACQDQQIDVPAEMSILGVDNLIGTCELASVPISSVSQDFSMIGNQAARVLDAMMSGARPPRSATLVRPGPIVVRRSTDIFAFEDQRVADAMRMIHEHGASGLHVKELTSRMGVSRTWLDNQFRITIGHSASDEIRRVRLSHLKELLGGTDLSVQEIARRCGFGSSENLTHFMRRAQNVAPLEYRRSHRGVP